MERVGSERVVVAVDAEDSPWCSAGPELVSDRLFSLGASAVSELPPAEAAVGSGDGSGSGSGTAHGAGPGTGTGTGRSSGPVVRMVADLPAASLDELSATGWRFDVLEVDPSWNAGWRDHATAVEVGERLVLRPEWVEPTSVEPDRVEPTSFEADRVEPDRVEPDRVEPDRVEPDRVEVVLDAADAFGSGSHPTTRLCLEAMERLVAAGSLARARVLDVGCGTGVLGVAALALADGATLVAIDVEPAAVVATARTAELNGVADRTVEVSDRPLAEVVDEHGPFDVVLANLLVPIIESLGADLAAAVAPGGHLVLSGLLSDPESGHVDRAIDAVGPALGPPSVATVTARDGWAVVELG